MPRDFFERHRVRHRRARARAAAVQSVRALVVGLFAALAAAGYIPYVYSTAGMAGAPRVPRPGDNFSASAELAAGPYNARPEHIWNRLYRHLCVRETAAGREFGYDSLDPLLWNETKYLRSGSSSERAIALLDEFISTRAERLINDPLKRALMQRDLWAVFDWLSVGGGAGTPAQVRELQMRLALVIRRIALTKEQIGALPDNYARASDARAFPAEYSSDRPEAPFLPPDLFRPGGPWVCLGNESGAPVAPIHTQSFAGRSTFLILLRLPGGREATLAYLKTLRDFPQPWVRESGDLVPNPALPQFPTGTQLALVRRLTLVDEDGDLIPSTLTESVQLRVYTSARARTGVGRSRESQDVYKFSLSRTKLFGGEAGGLSPATAREKELPVFMSQGVDWLEAEGDGVLENAQEVILSSCTTCHAAAGVHSMMSFSQPRFSEYGTAPRLGEATPVGEAGAAVRWKRGRFEWGLLQGLWWAGPPAGRRADFSHASGK